MIRYERFLNLIVGTLEKYINDRDQTFFRNKITQSKIFKSNYLI